MLPSHGTRVDNLINYRSLDDDVISTFDIARILKSINIKNDPKEALANPKEAKCTDGLKLMETVQFLCHRNLDFKAKNNHGKSFLDLVTGKDTSGLCRLVRGVMGNRKLTYKSQRCETNCEKIYRS